MGAQSWGQWADWKGSLTATLEHAQAEAMEARDSGSDPDLGEDPGQTMVERAFAILRDADPGILEIEGLTNAAGDGCCWLVPFERYLELFGAPMPSREDLDNDDALIELVDQLERGQALCVIAFKDEKPAHVYFAGWTSD